MQENGRQEDSRPETQSQGGKIPEPERRGERLAGLLLLGLAALNFPLLSIFSEGGSVCGIPVLYFYLFSVWSVIIGVSAFALRNRPPAAGESLDRQEPPEG